MRKDKTKDFVCKANVVHNGIYDYSEVVYLNNRSKINIICNKHGVFYQSPRHHLSGHGCKKCANDKLNTDRKLTVSKFIEISNDKHANKYDYTFVNYINNSKKVDILCHEKNLDGSEHGLFQQSPSSHMNGYGCPICSITNTYNNNQMIQRFNEKHGNLYDYSLTEYKNMKTKIKIICSKHGVFQQSPSNHLFQNGCPKCRMSTGEIKIKNILDDNSIKYEMEHSFIDCRYKSALYFDFYIKNINTCIEYNGIQHYKPVSYFGGVERFNDTIIRDEVKKSYCEKNNINLIIIKYNQEILPILLENNIINNR
jgi:hypothetical protein